MDKAINETTQRMKKAVDAFHHELTKLRTGRASLALLDDVKVDYYGQMSPLNQVGTLAVPDPRTITIQPWDTTAAQAIEKAIQKADLGLNPINDGKVIRVPVPALNEERRKDLVKVLHAHAEQSKVAIRNARRDANENLKKLQKDGDITEDDLKKGQDKVQKLTDDHIKQVDDAAKHKEKDIMEV
jgi:ribosome recycling factor